jgi:SAM-dependent methyltransferase
MGSSAAHVFIAGLQAWMDPARLLGPGSWTFDGPTARAELPLHAAADLDARLRNVSIGGYGPVFSCTPALPRAAVRAARTTEARRHRDTTPGFTRPGARLDAEGRVSLTPEAIAAEIGARVAGLSVVDAGCGAGGNTIGFARAGCAVTAVERSAERLADAAHNAALYGVSGRIRFLRGDVEDRLRELDGDVLFADPPWGADWSRSGMGLVDLPLLAAVLAHAGRFARVLLKLPPSFRVRELPEFRPEAVFGRATGDHRRVKFLLLDRKR